MRTSTAADHLLRLDRVRAHLEADLTRTPDLKELARVAHLSPFHFHRIFHALVGESPAAHLRRLRLEKAALLLRHSPRSITEAALEVGYESPAAFSRAFERHFGSAPSAWRTASTSPPDLSAPAAQPISPERILHRPDTRVLFLRRHGPYAESAPAAWAGLMSTLAWRAWLALPTEMLGICHDDPGITSSGAIRYDACLALRLPLKPRGELAEKIIPGGRHAVFLHQGPHALLPETYDRIYGHWLPRSEERLAEAPAFELYLDHPDRVAPARLRTLIHLPLLPRQA